MSDQDMSLRVKIETAYDGKGSKEAINEVNKLNDATKQTDQTNKQFSASINQSGQSLGRAAETAGSLATALDAGGPAASKMGGAVRGLSSIVSGATQGIAGLASVLMAAALTAYIKYQKKVEEAKEALLKFREEVDANKLALQQTEISNISTFYNDLSSAIDKASASQARLNQAMAAADSVEKAERMALLDLEEKRSLNQLPAGDSLARSETSASFATQRRELDQEFQARSAERVAETAAKALADALEKSKIAGLAVSNTRESLGSVDDQRAAAQAELGALYTTKIPTKKVNVNQGPMGHSSPVTVIDKKTQNAEALRLKKLLYDDPKYGTPGGPKDPGGLEGQYKDLAAALAANTEQLRANEIEAQAARIIAESAVRQYDTVSNINPLLNKESGRADLIQSQYGREQQYSAAQEKYSSLAKTQGKLQASALKEEGDVRRAKNTNADLKVIEKEAAEATKALEAVKEFLKENASTMRSLQSEMRTAKEALRNLPNS